MIKNGSVGSFRPISTRVQAVVSCLFLAACSLPVIPCGAAPAAAPTKKPEAKSEPKGDGKSVHPGEPAKHEPAKPKEEGAKAEKKPEPKPEVIIENVQDVTTEQLVDKPHDFLNKNVKFDATFFCFASLALDYKPALRAQKSYLSFLVLRPNTKIPYSELKLAMPIPKEKDPDNDMLAKLKEGDQLEITGHVFATALDEPWVDVLKLKKTASAPEKKDDEKKADESEAK